LNPRLPLLLTLAAIAATGCRRQPGEPVFVIRADGTVVSAGGSDADTTASVTGPDSILVPDSSAVDSLPLPDTLPVFDVLEGASVLAVEIRGSLYATLSTACPDDDPDVLGAHLTRCLWWSIDPWRGICSGDSLLAVYRDSGWGLENRTVALRYIPVSGAPGFSLYLYRRSGDNYPSYWHPDGTETVRMPDEMPVGTFEEITGIVGEPRGDHTHGGIDFKAPEGTPVRTPHGGRVVRMDWNTEYNGRCLELDIGGGYTEMFLHLQGIAPELSTGATAAEGSLVGWVGNTGRSFSAHLHYQINDENGYPIDPLVFSGSHVRTLGPADLADFSDFQAACDSLMDAGAAP
jgi:hypothetical protein